MIQLACLCGSTACSFCCSQCPTCRNSTSTRIMYALLLMLGTIAACVTLAPGLQDALKKVNIFKFRNIIDIKTDLLFIYGFFIGSIL